MASSEPSILSLFSEPITRISVEDFRRHRSAAWTQNSAVWIEHTENDESRVAVYRKVLSLLQKHTQQDHSKKIVDLACGAAGFYAFCVEKLSEVEYLGFDASIEMLAAAVIASGDEIRVSTIDLEREPLPDVGGGLFVCLFAAFELIDLNAFFANVSSGMRKGDTLVLNVFDPLIEVLRHEKYKRGSLGARYFTVDGHIGTASHFYADGLLQDSTSFRFLHQVSVDWRSQTH